MQIIAWSNKRFSIQPAVQQEAYMGKYIAYTLVVVVVLFFLEWFQIVDIPYVDLPNLAEQQKEAVEKSEDNMRRRFGD